MTRRSAGLPAMETHVASIDTKLERSVLTITINNPTKRNAFTHSMVQQLGDALDLAEKDMSVRCVIIVGVGEVAFSSGHDLSGLVNDRSQAADQHVNEPFARPQLMSKPTIAVVNGAARAGGFVLALSCDLRVCEPHASFGASGARIGLLPIGGQLSRLPLQMPPAIALEMLFTGRSMDAHEAARWGFCNKVCEPGTALDEGVRLAQLVAESSASVVSSIKRGINLLMEEGVAAARAYEWSEGQRLQFEPDADEGIRAFLEKRQPQFL